MKRQKDNCPSSLKTEGVQQAWIFVFLKKTKNPALLNPLLKHRILWFFTEFSLSVFTQFSTQSYSFASCPSTPFQRLSARYRRRAQKLHVLKNIKKPATAADSDQIPTFTYRAGSLFSARLFSLSRDNVFCRKSVFCVPKKKKWSRQNVFLGETLSGERGKRRPEKSDPAR